MDEHGAAESKPLWKRRWFKFAAGAASAVVVVCSGALVLWFVDDPTEGEPTDCAAVMDTAGFAALPVETSAATCTEGGFQDPFATVEFTAHSSDVDAWLAEELPGFEPMTELCGDADTCLEVSWDGPDAPQESGWHLKVGLTDHTDGTTAVSVTVFTL